MIKSTTFTQCDNLIELVLQNTYFLMGISNFCSTNKGDQRLKRRKIRDV